MHNVNGFDDFQGLFRDELSFVEGDFGAWSNLDDVQLDFK